MTQFGTRGLQSSDGDRSQSGASVAYSKITEILADFQGMSESSFERGLKYSSVQTDLSKLTQDLDVALLPHPAVTKLLNDLGVRLTSPCLTLQENGARVKELLSNSALAPLLIPSLFCELSFPSFFARAQEAAYDALPAPWDLGVHSPSQLTGSGVVAKFIECSERNAANFAALNLLDPETRNLVSFELARGVFAGVPEHTRMTCADRYLGILNRFVPVPVVYGGDREHLAKQYGNTPESKLTSPYMKSSIEAEMIAYLERSLADAEMIPPSMAEMCFLGINPSYFTTEKFEFALDQWSRSQFAALQLEGQRLLKDIQLYAQIRRLEDRDGEIVSHDDSTLAGFAVRYVEFRENFGAALNFMNAGIASLGPRSHLGDSSRLPGLKDGDHDLTLAEPQFQRCLAQCSYFFLKLGSLKLLDQPLGSRVPMLMQESFDELLVDLERYRFGESKFHEQVFRSIKYAFAQGDLNSACALVVLFPRDSQNLSVFSDFIEDKLVEFRPYVMKHIARAANFLTHTAAQHRERGDVLVDDRILAQNVRSLGQAISVFLSHGGVPSTELESNPLLRNDEYERKHEQVKREMFASLTGLVSELVGHGYSGAVLAHEVLRGMSPELCTSIAQNFEVGLLRGIQPLIKRVNDELLEASVHPDSILLDRLEEISVMHNVATRFVSLLPDYLKEQIEPIATLPRDFEQQYQVLTILRDVEQDGEWVPTISAGAFEHTLNAMTQRHRMNPYSAIQGIYSLASALGREHITPRRDLGKLLKSGLELYGGVPNDPEVLSSLREVPDYSHEVALAGAFRLALHQRDRASLVKITKSLAGLYKTSSEDHALAGAMAGLSKALGKELSANPDSNFMPILKAHLTQGALRGWSIRVGFAQSQMVAT